MEELDQFRAVRGIEAIYERPVQALQFCQEHEERAGARGDATPRDLAELGESRLDLLLVFLVRVIFDVVQFFFTQKIQGGEVPYV